MSAGVVAVAATGVTLSVKNSARKVRARVKGTKSVAPEPDASVSRLDRDLLR
jgi:hypothetical protein